MRRAAARSRAATVRAGRRQRAHLAVGDHALLRRLAPGRALCAVPGDGVGGGGDAREGRGLRGDARKGRGLLRSSRLDVFRARGEDPLGRPERPQATVGEAHGSLQWRQGDAHRASVCRISVSDIRRHACDMIRCRRVAGCGSRPTPRSPRIISDTMWASACVECQGPGHLPEEIGAAFGDRGCGRRACGTEELKDYCHRLPAVSGCVCHWVGAMLRSTISARVALALDARGASVLACGEWCGAGRRHPLPTPPARPTQPGSSSSHLAGVHRLRRRLALEARDARGRRLVRRLAARDRRERRRAGVGAREPARREGEAVERRVG